MTFTDRTIRKAALRLFVVSLVRNLVVCITVSAVAMVVARLAERLVAVSIDWPLAWMIAGGAAVVGAIVWTVVAREDAVGVAREVDEAADLKESLSTALCVRGSDDPWSRAAVEQAETVSKRVVVKQLFPVRVPDWSYVPVVAVALFFALALIPMQNIFGRNADPVAADEKAVEIQQAAAEVEQVKDELREQFAGLGDEQLQKELEGLLTPEEIAEPDEIRREAVKKMTAMRDRLSELSGGEDAEAMEELEAKLSQLKSQQAMSAELDALTKALQKGDFKAAESALDELAKKLESKELSDAERKALEEQLKKLAEQLDQLAQDREKLEKQLEQMGIDPKLAQDPEALQKALEKMELSPEMQEKLMSQCKACNSACKQCNSMSAAMAKACQGGQPGSEGMSEMGQMMSSLEAMKQDMESSQAAMQALEKQMAGMCEGMGNCDGQAMAMMKFQMQSKSRGKGGDGEQSAEADFNLNSEKAQSKDHGGPIVGSVMVEGEQVKGEAAQQFAEAVATSSQQAADAIETMQIPREYHELIKKYYGRLEAKAGDKAGAEPAEDAAE